MSIADQMGLFDGSQPLPIVAYTDTETDTERSKK